MLFAQNAHQLDELAGFLKAREEVFLLVFFVVILDKVPDDLGGFGQKLRIEQTLPCHPPRHFLINEQHAVENAVLAH